MREWVLLVALVVASPACSGEEFRAGIRDLREDVRRMRPLLPEPAGLAADGISMILALIGWKTSRTARRRISRSGLRRNHELARD